MPFTFPLPDVYLPSSYASPVTEEPQTGSSFYTHYFTADDNTGQQTTLGPAQSTSSPLSILLLLTNNTSFENFAFDELELYRPLLLAVVLIENQIHTSPITCLAYLTGPALYLRAFRPDHPGGQQ